MARITEGGDCRFSEERCDLPLLSLHLHVLIHLTVTAAILIFQPQTHGCLPPSLRNTSRRRTKNFFPFDEALALIVLPQIYCSFFLIKKSSIRLRHNDFRLGLCSQTLSVSKYIAFSGHILNTSATTGSEHSEHHRRTVLRIVRYIGN